MLQFAPLANLIITLFQAQKFLTPPITSYLHRLLLVLVGQGSRTQQLQRGDLFDPSTCDHFPSALHMNGSVEVCGTLCVYV